MSIVIKTRAIPANPRSKNYPPGSVVVSSGGGDINVVGGGSNVDIIKTDDSRSLTDENVLSSLRTLHEIESRIVKEGDLDAILKDDNVFSSLRTLYEIRSRIIKKGDNTEKTDGNVLSALRTMFEIQSRILKKDDTTTPETDDNTFSSLRIIEKIKDAISTLEDVYVSKQHNDIASGHITFEQGIYVKGMTAGEGQSILEEDNSILEEDNGIIEEVVSEPAPTPLTLGGLDNVNDIVDNPSNKDVILVRKAGSLEWTQEDKSISETIPEAPKDGKQYARQDGAWSVVKATSVDVPTKLSQLENDADYVQDPDYIHTDNNFTSLLKDQLSKLTTEYLNDANKLNYQRSRAFFAKAHADTSGVWGFVRYFNNLPTLTDSQVRITGVRSDFNGDLLSDSYVNIPGATQTLAGVMTAADKTKLDGIQLGATRVIVDSVMSETSLNPVQNKVITSKFIQLEGRTTGLESQYNTLSNTLSPIAAAWNKRGAKDGFLILGENGIISSVHLPSYVDDVLEVYATYDKSATGVLSNIKLYTDLAHTAAVVPETGKIYIDITPGKPHYQFRWSGTTYVDLNTGGLILGTITGTAYDGGEGSKNRASIDSLPNSLITNISSADIQSDKIRLGFYSSSKTNNLYSSPADNKSITIPAATSTKAGVMSAADKKKLDDLVDFQLPETIIYAIRANHEASYITLVYDIMYPDGTPDSDMISFDGATATKAGLLTASDKIRLDKTVTIDGDQTITGLKHIKNDLYIDDVDSDKKVIISKGTIRILPYSTGSSAQGLYFCNPSNNEILGVLGGYFQNGVLNRIYIGTGYDESNNWVTFTPTITTIRGKADVKGSLTVSAGAGGLNGIVASSGNGLLMYSGDTTYLSQSSGSTYIRSGDTNLYHTRTNTNYAILDMFNTPNPFCYRGAASASHIDLTDTAAGAPSFVNYNSGTYQVSRGGSTEMYIKFQGSGSTSGLELYTNYQDGDSLKFRKIVDNNRISGSWSVLLDQKNWNGFIKFERLTDKPLISVEKSSNSLIKRSTNGEVYINNAPLYFTEQSTYEASQTAWAIATNGTGGNMSIEQKKGSGGNLLLNGYRVATAKDKYVMSKYTIDASSLDESTYYPVTIKLNGGQNYRIEVLVQLDSGTKPSWSTHASGFSVRFIEEVQGNGWGTLTISRKIIDFAYQYCIEGAYPIKRVYQMTNSSTEVIYVRGGGKYTFYVSGSGSNTPEPILRTSTYTVSGESVSPTPSANLEFNVSRNIIMTADVNTANVPNTIVKRDTNGYVLATQFYQSKGVEDNKTVTNVVYESNNDGYFRKCTLDRFNRQISFRKLPDLLVYTSEFNFIPNNYSGDIWINNHTTELSNTGNIGEYRFRNGNSDGDYSKLRASGFIIQGSTDNYALTGGGSNILISEEITSNTLVKRTGEGHIKVKDVISSSYQLHHDADNPYLKLSAAGNNYFIQAAASGIWMGPSATDKSLIINSVGCAGLGILPNSNYKLYVNGNIRSASTINAGEAVDMGYGYINVARPNTVENASCFSWVREGQKAFALGFNSNNKIVLGQGKTDKTLTPWLSIGESSSMFGGHLDTQTVSTEYGEFNHDLGRMLSNTQTVTGTICITLPQGFINSMNMYEIYIYEYTGETCGNRILVSGYNYGGSSSWVNYKYTAEGNYYKGVRLGYKGGKCCILLGTTTTTWLYPQVYLANVYAGFGKVNLWKQGYTIGVITSESDVTNIVTVPRSNSRAYGFVKDESDNNHVLLGGGGHLSYAEGAISNTLVKRTGNGYIFGKFFNSDNPVQDTLTVTNLFFETGSDGYHRKASLGRVTDSMRVATQTLKGLMSAEDKKKVDLFDPSKYIRRDIDDDALGHITFHKGIYVDGGIYDGQSIMEADGVNGIMEADGVNGIIEYSEPAPVATSMTLGELTNVSSSVNTAASSKVMLVKGAGETLWTQEAITPNILKGFIDTRTVATTPNDYNSKFTVVGLKQNSAIGSPNADSYSYIIGYRGWMDSSGGKSHELAFNNQGIYHRIGSTASWESWSKILTSENWDSFITIPTSLKNPKALTFTGAVTGTYDGSSAMTVAIPSMPDLSPYAKKDFSNVTTQSLGQNGYCKFPNGVLIQWGYVSSAAATGTVTFPVAFYDNSYALSFGIQHNTSTTDFNPITVCWTSIRSDGYSYKKSYVLGDTGAGSSRPFYWQAIGRWK